MKKLILAAAALGLMATSAAAQYGQPHYYPEYRRPPPPPVYLDPRYSGPPAVVGPSPGWRHARPYNWCAAKAQRLQEFEYRMQMDGRVSRDEVRIARSLRADLDASCGGGRWGPNRGWHYN